MSPEASPNSEKASLVTTSKKVAIVQSNYIPWKGYFDMIGMVDEFILYDDMQYTRRDWRNRNKIKTPQGVNWLTIPVEVSGKFSQSIKDTKIADTSWAATHWETIKRSYAHATAFAEYRDFFEDLYLNCKETYLSQINHRFLTAIAKLLGIKTLFSWSSDYVLVEGKTEKLVNLCQQAKAQHYLSGPAARDYIDEALFKNAGVEVLWMDYTNYPAYRQLHGPFDHAVSIIDLILNEGSEAKKYLKCLNPGISDPS